MRREVQMLYWLYWLKMREIAARAIRSGVCVVRQGRSTIAHWSNTLSRAPPSPPPPARSGGLADRGGWLFGGRAGNDLRKAVERRGTPEEREGPPYVPNERDGSPQAMRARNANWVSPNLFTVLQTLRCRGSVRCNPTNK
jgi:hypothetical protein